MIPMASKAVCSIDNDVDWSIVAEGLTDVIADEK